VVVRRGDRDQFIAARTATNPDFPELVSAEVSGS